MPSVYPISTPRTGTLERWLDRKARRPGGARLTTGLNQIHTMNMIQTSERRERSRAARRDAFLDATRELIEEHGIEALTIKAVAERVDCAVGTLYTYFSSKSALVAALQAEAITRLGAAYSRAADRLEDDLATLAIDVDTAALARLVAFGRSIIAVGQVLPEEYRLQQRLLSAQTGYDDDDLALVAPVAFAVLARTERLLREAAALRGRGAEPGALAAADAAVPRSRMAALLDGSHRCRPLRPYFSPSLAARSS